MRNRSGSGTRAKGSMPSVLQDVSKYDSQLAEMRLKIHDLEAENEKLRTTMRDMVDDYTR
jgi:cell division protein FtsB